MSGNNAFAECSSLKGVSLPSSVMRMGERSFYQCGLLESISLPNQMTEIEDAFFVSRLKIDPENSHVVYCTGILRKVAIYRE